MPKGYPDTVTCKGCGAGMPADMAYCYECGEALPSSKLTRGQKKIQKENSKQPSVRSR